MNCIHHRNDTYLPLHGNEMLVVTVMGFEILPDKAPSRARDLIMFGGRHEIRGLGDKPHCNLW